MQTTTFCLLALALLISADRAAADPTPDQVAAIKANCRSDFMSNCWGVKRGGAEAFQCLKEHMSSLSAGCQTAIKAATPAPAPAKAPAAAKEPAPAPAAAEPTPAAPAEPQPQQEAAPAKQPETKAASPAPQKSTPPPAPKAVAAPPPQQAAPQAAPPAKAANAEAPAAPEAAAASPAPGPPAIIGFIPLRKKLMVQRNCRQELETYCDGIDVGQGRVLRCLFSHQSDLTPDCQGAIAKLSN